ANATVAVAEEKAPGFFRKIYLRMVDSVPVSKEKDIVLDHDYDGIKELDNNLPPWWKYGFYLTIVFSFLYMFVYHVTGTGKLQLAEYNDELHAAQLAKAERMKSSAENITEDNVVALKETDVLAKGKDSYDKLCAACHRADGGGQVGPNLTDEFWLHGGGIKNIFHTITYGVPDKGMISWQSQLSPKQIQYVASYLMTMQGTKPAGPKEPQGEKWTEVAATTADSTTTATADSLSK
ncbi:MAG TPA: cbb3-type cytochrome c oxidase N-terminal domain-containing protein, partial [Bacteroidia bacterium]|nr:cbb3-type cytochrome c oxidase N-terminal domain-containing protein [Bacteroidia bacterium]